MLNFFRHPKPKLISVEIRRVYTDVDIRKFMLAFEFCLSLHCVRTQFAVFNNFHSYINLFI